MTDDDRTAGVSPVNGSWPKCLRDRAAGRIEQRARLSSFEVDDDVTQLRGEKRCNRVRFWDSGVVRVARFRRTGTVFDPVRRDSERWRQYDAVSTAWRDPDRSILRG